MKKINLRQKIDKYILDNKEKRERMTPREELKRGRLLMKMLMIPYIILNILIILNVYVAFAYLSYSSNEARIEQGMEQPNALVIAEGYEKINEEAKDIKLDFWNAIHIVTGKTEMGTEEKIEFEEKISRALNFRYKGSFLSNNKNYGTTFNYKGVIYSVEIDSRLVNKEKEEDIITETYEIKTFVFEGENRDEATNIEVVKYEGQFSYPKGHIMNRPLINPVSMFLIGGFFFTLMLMMFVDENYQQKTKTRRTNR